jgi:CRP-like cAMP-binding protein
MTESKRENGNRIRKLFNDYCSLQEDELDLVIRGFSQRNVQKGKYILRQGQTCHELIYVLKGVFRQYYKDSDDKEITTWIAFEDTFATELVSFITQEPSHFYVQAIQNCEIITISHKDLQRLYSEIPHLQEFGRKIAEEVLVGAINRIVTFQKETADIRYNRLLKRPEYFQKVPLKYLASFIGVTDTSLSRLRRKK